MKKYLFSLFCFGAFCEVSFTKIYADVVPKDRYKSSYSEKSPEAMSDAELDRLMGELVGETPEDFSEAVVDSKGDVVLAEVGRSNGASSKTAKSGNFPTGFWIGVGLAQSWDVARNHTKVWYGRNMQEQQWRKVSDAPFLAKSRRARVDPAFSVGYSTLFSTGIWLSFLGEVLAGSLKEKVDQIHFSGIQKPIKDSLKIFGVSYSLKVQPGYLIRKADAVLYGILGLRWKKVKCGINLKDSLSRPQLLLGLGFEKRIYKSLTLCLNYEYACRSHSFKSNAGVSTEVSKTYNQVSRDGKLNLNTHSVQVEVKYYL